MRNRKNYTYNVLLGLNRASEPIAWIWDHANALAVIGKGGSGKTTNASYWLSQLACQGVRFLMADPHMDNKESLYANTKHLHEAFIAPCVKEYKDITKAIDTYHALGHERINNRAEHFPLVFVIDEFTSYLLSSEDTKHAALKLLDSANQYRKVGLRLMLIGQSWGDAVKKASSLRDAISDSVVLRSAYNNALKFCSFAATAKEANVLPVGRGYFMDEMIWIPRLTGTDKLVTFDIVREYQHGGYTNTPVLVTPIETPIVSPRKSTVTKRKNIVTTRKSTKKPILPYIDKTKEIFLHAIRDI